MAMDSARSPCQLEVHLSLRTPMLRAEKREQVLELCVSLMTPMLRAEKRKPVKSHTPMSTLREHKSLRVSGRGERFVQVVA